MKKTALITGATGGLGLSIANKLEASGWRLIVTSRSAEGLTNVYGKKHLQIVADCSTVEGVKHIFEAIKQHDEIPTALAHCVGNIRLGALHRMSEVDFMDCMQANLFSAFHTLAAFIRSLKETGSVGAAVLVSSAAARIGTPNHEAISAAKCGVEGLVRGAAATYAANGIRVNAVAPGIMDTPAAAKILSSELIREVAARQYPLASIGTSDELANLIIWLLSDEAARVTGQVWSLDAGFSTIRPYVK
jgi:NAD(P)-dependent dehydrogenase (short-subunit alcohol dehydrogenase family)